MKRTNCLAICIALCVAMLIPALGYAQFAKPKPKPGDPPPGVQAAQVPMVSCQRGGLQHAVRLYLAAQAKGDISILPLANGVSYQENMKPADIKTVFITKPLVIDKTLSIYDDASCQTFTEVIVSDSANNKANPYVVGVRLRVNNDNIAEFEVITTTTGCSMPTTTWSTRRKRIGAPSLLTAAIPVQSWFAEPTPTWTPSLKARPTWFHGATRACGSKVV